MDILLLQLVSRRRTLRVAFNAKELHILTIERAHSSEVMVLRGAVAYVSQLTSVDKGSNRVYRLRDACVSAYVQEGTPGGSYEH